MPLSPIEIQLVGVCLRAVDDHMREDKPPVTRQTFNRLTQAGIDASRARSLIAMAIAVEVDGMIAGADSFDHDRYVRNLDRLPNDQLEGF